ncbi:HDOD domain-containing protein [Undibacterium sp. TS12]|uniref:HDOD domain-containing protein n=1 Tax=Undibacterium sp. TS12 TaxID=2908202 RepID=UPI001F4CDD9C|nr:HDOD domain-containing protein [Undibacterium sp. TS12]
MLTFLRRLFGMSPPSGQTAEPASQPATSETVPASESDAPASTEWQAAFDVDSRFYPWLLGRFASQVSNGAEKPLLVALERLCRADFSDTRHIPRVPSVLPQLLKSLRNEYVSGDELAGHIAKDVSLVAEIISEVNSSYYSPADKISNLDNAIRLLGINGLRMLVARTAFRPLIQLQAGHVTSVVAPLIWEQSEKCAQACRQLAQERGLDAFHAYLAGLLQNIGLIIAFRALDQIMTSPTMPLATAFRLRFFHMAHILSYRISREWDFPEAVMGALKDQVSHESPLQGLGLVVRQASDISKLSQMVNAGVCNKDDEGLQLSTDAQIQRCFSALHAREGET